MTRFYDIDEANATLGELESIATVLAEQRAELVRLRDHALARSPGTANDVEPLSDDELRTLRLRMQGLVDQMAAGVARIDQLGQPLVDVGEQRVEVEAGRVAAVLVRLLEADPRTLEVPRDALRVATHRMDVRGSKLDQALE